MNDVERTSHAAARLEYHHSSGVQTIIARARDLQDIRERRSWMVLGVKGPRSKELTTCRLVVEYGIGIHTCR